MYNRFYVSWGLSCEVQGMYIMGGVCVCNILGPPLQLALVVFFFKALAHLLMYILQLSLCGGIYYNGVCYDIVG